MKLLGAIYNLISGLDFDTRINLPLPGHKELVVKAHIQTRGEERYIIEKNPIYTGHAGDSEILKGRSSTPIVEEDCKANV